MRCVYDASAPDPGFRALWFVRKVVEISTDGSLTWAITVVTVNVDNAGTVHLGCFTAKIVFKSPKRRHTLHFYNIFHTQAVRIGNFRFLFTQPFFCTSKCKDEENNDIKISHLSVQRSLSIFTTVGILLDIKIVLNVHIYQFVFRYVWRIRDRAINYRFSWIYQIYYCAKMMKNCK